MASTSLKNDDDAIEFPPVDGFGLRLVLRESPPTSPPPESDSEHLAPSRGGPKAPGTQLPARTAAAGTATATPTGSPVPTPTPTPTASPTPSPAAASGSPATSAATTPSPAASAAQAAVKVEVKLTTYPDGAPELPSTAGFAPRRALAKGYLVVQRDLTVRGPAAFEFILPPSERTTERAFTIAVYESLKRNKLKLVAQDPGGVLDGERVRGGSQGSEAPLLLRRGRGYTAILYAADTPPTPAPSGGGFPSPGASGNPGSPGWPPPAGASPVGVPSPGASPSAASTGPHGT